MKWKQNKEYNPITHRKIKINSSVYKKFNKKYNDYFPNDYCYIDSIEDRDIFSLERFWIENNSIKEMVYLDLDELILYKDDKGLVHCFEKKSLDYMKHYNIRCHPITKEVLPEDIFNLCKDISIDINIIDRAKNIFNLLTKISIFIDSSNFINLSINKIDKLHYETRYFYDENISSDIKNVLNIFIKTPNNFNNMKLLEKQKYMLDCYEIMLSYNTTNNITYMISYIIVGGLITVIPSIKEDYNNITFNDF